MHVPAGPHGIMKPWFVAEKDANKNIITIVSTSGWGRGGGVGG